MNIIPNHNFGEIELKFYEKQLSLTLTQESKATTDDLEQLFLQKTINDYTITDVQTLWQRFFVKKGITQTTDLQDAWKRYLVTLGYSGHIYDQTVRYFKVNS